MTVKDWLCDRPVFGGDPFCSSDGDADSSDDGNAGAGDLLITSGAGLGKECFSAAVCHAAMSNIPSNQLYCNSTLVLAVY